MDDAPAGSPPVRRAYRDPEDRFLGGVAAGLAAHLGVPALHVRLAFLLSTLVGGFGAVVYAGLWISLPIRPEGAAMAGQAPGVAAATRDGRRPGVTRRQPRDVAVVISLAACVLGVLILMEGFGFGIRSSLFWPVLVGAAGVVLLWWQADESWRSRWLQPNRGWQTLARTGIGIALLLGGLSLMVLRSGVRGSVPVALAAVVLAAGGVLLVVGPWLLRANRDLRFERAERIRSQERADVAAHLHDSVLQTLALIQRNADDSRAVAHLARTQERELRRWLFDPTDRRAASLGTELRDIAAEVEDALGVPVEIVVVGDVTGEAYAAVAGAAREAMQNAARHSGADRIDVYAELGAAGAEVFVRDRGRGFDPAAVSGDRRGISGSIVGRMARFGGSADVRTTLGTGTEIRLWMPAEQQGSDG